MPAIQPVDIERLILIAGGHTAFQLLGGMLPRGKIRSDAPPGRLYPP